MSDPGLEDPFLSPRTVAEYFEVTVPTIRKWIKEGKIAATKVGGTDWRIRTSEVHRLAQESYGDE